MPSLRALECLVAVADAGSITEAARRLHSSQPAVSHQLAGLEREARTPLLRRDRRGITLTPAGRAALTDARRAVEAADAAMQAARTATAAGGGTLRLGCAQSLTVPLLAPLVRLWHRRHPQVVLSVRESATPAELFGWIDGDDVDVLVVPGPVDDRFVSTPVALEEVVVSLASDHPLSAQSSVALDQLDDQPLIHFAASNGLGDWLDRAFTAAAIRPLPVMRTSVTTAAPQLAAAGLGAAVTPVSAITSGLPGAVRSFEPPWIRQLVAVTAARPDPLAERFISAMRSRGVRVPKDIRDQLTATS